MSSARSRKKLKKRRYNEGLPLDLGKTTALLNRLEDPRFEEDVDVLDSRLVVDACSSLLISARPSLRPASSRTFPFGSNDDSVAIGIGDLLDVIAAVLEDELLQGVLVHEVAALVEVLEIVDVCGSNVGERESISSRRVEGRRELRSRYVQNLRPLKISDLFSNSVMGLEMY